MGADTQRAYRKEIEDVLLAAAQWIRLYYNVALVSADFVPGREQPESDSKAASSSGSASAAPAHPFRANIGKVGVPASGVRETVTEESWTQSGARLPPTAKMGPHSPFYCKYYLIACFLLLLRSHVLTLQRPANQHLARMRSLGTKGAWFSMSGSA